MAITASAVLVSNCLTHNPQRTEIQNSALDDIIRERKVGAIAITEPEHGSDSVNLRTLAQINDNGAITYNGTKI